MSYYPINLKPHGVNIETKHYSDNTCHICMHINIQCVHWVHNIIWVLQDIEAGVGQT